MWSIDGMDWDYPCTINRVADIESSSISGMMMDGTYFNDVLGTYLRYSVSVAVPIGKESKYDAIYKLLTAPDSYHRFEFPYGQTMVSINGRVSMVSDSFVRLSGSKQTWRKITFDVTSNTPTRRGERSYGITPYPAAPSVPVGTLFEKTADGWQKADIADADSRRY